MSTIKLANLCADLPTSHISSSTVFKAVVSGDGLTAQRKHQPAFQFRPFAQLLFSANSFPKSHDSSDGFYRRWLVVPFNRSFEGSSRRNKRELDAELQQPSQLSGLLNRALEVLPRLRQYGFTDTDSLRDATADFRQTTDPKILSGSVKQQTMVTTPRRTRSTYPLGSVVLICK